MVKDISLLIFDFDSASPDAIGEAMDWADHFHEIVTATTNENTSLEAVNNKLSEVTSDWILWLRNGEKPDLNSLKDLDFTNTKKCYEALISLENESSHSKMFEIRLFPNHPSIEFRGTIYPNCTESILEQGFDVTSESFLVEADRTTTKQVTYEEAKPVTAYDYLALGLSTSKQGHHQAALSHYSQAVKMNHLAKHDRMAAFNGLANSYYEQKNRPKCLEMIEKSLQVSQKQCMPYLLRFRLAYNSKAWDQAYAHLMNYLTNLAEGSHANFDVTIPLTETHYLLGDCALKAGMNDRAHVHYEEYFELSEQENRAIPEDVLERLLFFSVQLEEKEQAIRYFNKLYADRLDQKITDETWKKIDRKLALFNEKEWYEFTGQCYETLFASNRENKNILRRWVAILIKQGDVETAQDLLSKHKGIIS